MSDDRCNTGNDARSKYRRRMSLKDHDLFLFDIPISEEETDMKT